VLGRRLEMLAAPARLDLVQLPRSTRQQLR
jgi:hypothetical protein